MTRAVGVADGPFDRTIAASRSPLKLGLATFATALALFALAELLLRGVILSAPEPPQTRDLRIGFVLCALFAWVVAAAAHAREGARECMRGLQAALPDDADGFERRLAEIGGVPVRSARLAGVAGLLLAALVPLVVDRGLPVRIDALWHSPEMIFHRLFGTVLAWILGRTAHLIWTDAGRVSWAACDLKAVDLLDLSLLAPFSRYGLRVSLLAVGFLGIAAILVTDQGLTEVVLGGLLPATVVFATAGLLRPVFGARRRIRSEKIRELTSIRRAIAGDVAALAGSRLSARRAPCSLADLLAWEARIERVAEWPFDTPTLLRFTLALLVPLGSWLGGALAQLAIERVIR